MTENPYQPPTTAESASPLPADYLYRPLTGLTNVVSGLLLLSVILTAAVGVLDVLAYQLVPGYSTGEFELDFNTLSIPVAMMGAAVANGLTYIVCGIVFLIWTHRSTANAHALGAQGIQVTPGWAVGYWFIPIANLFKPYQAFGEVYRASVARESSNWEDKDLPKIFPAWWFCWIVGGILSRIESRATSNGLDLGSVAIPLSLTTTVLGVASGVLAILVVRSIASAQQTKSQLQSPPRNW